LTISDEPAAPIDKPTAWEKVAEIAAGQVDVSDVVELESVPQ
jgi:hypothetical protein